MKMNNKNSDLLRGTLLITIFSFLILTTTMKVHAALEPTLVSPSDGTTIEETTPLLEWIPGDQVTAQWVQLDNNQDYSSPVINNSAVSSAATSYQSPTLTNDTTYWWRVRTQRRSTWREWSSNFSFTVLLVTAQYNLIPSLSSPSDNTVITDNNSPTLSWSPPRGANSFNLQVTDDPNFVTTEFNEITSEFSYTLPPIVNDTYYWRVRAKNDTTTWGSWTPVWSFIVSASGDPFGGIPILDSPENNSILSSSKIRLDWTPPKSSSYFNYQVSDSSNFSSSSINGQSVASYLDITTNLPDNTYYWHVRAKSPTTSWGSWSEVWSFTIDSQLQGLKSFIQYSTFAGGSESEHGKVCSFDDKGNLWVLGTTYSYNFPTTPNAEDPTYNGGDSDCFILKFAPNRSIVYSSYIGGVGLDQAYDLEIDSEGNIWITGLTWSSDFPITVDAYDSTFDSEDSDIQPDAYLTKLASNGTIAYSTFIGGYTYDYGFGLAIDDKDNVWVTGSTQSSNIPTNNAYDPTFNGGNDVYVVCLAANGSMLLYGSYLGSSATERGYAIECYNDSIWISGYSNSVNFPTTPDADDGSLNGNDDAFIAKIDITTGDLVYSSFIGGSGNEYANPISFDEQGNVFITGYTNSIDFPTTSDAFDTTFGGNDQYDGFILKLWNNGSIRYSSYIGTSERDTGSGISLQDDGTVWLTGTTNSSSFPTTFDAVDQSHNGERDIFLMQFSNNLTNLMYSSVLGGLGNDFMYSAVFDNENNPWFVGGSDSNDFPTTPDAFNTSFSGIRDAIILQIAFPTISTPPLNLSATVDSNNHVLLSWEPPRDDGHSPISNYRVYRSKTSGVFNSHLFEVSNLTLSVLDETITTSGVYYYTVSAINAIGESDVSTEVSVTITIQPVHELSVPTVISPNGGETFIGSILIEWTLVTDTLDHNVTYDLYYSSDGVNWIVINLGLPNGTHSYNWDITAIPAGSSYLINVVATCSEDSSVYTEDFSDDTFTIQKSIIPTSTTSTTTSIQSESTTTTTTTSESGSFPDFFTVLLFLGTTIILIRKYKKK